MGGDDYNPWDHIPALPPEWEAQGHPPIHQSYYELIGQPYNDAPVPVIGWDARVHPSNRDLAEFLGIQAQEPVTKTDLPSTLVNTNEFGLGPNQKGFLDPYRFIKETVGEGTPPSLAMVYTDPSVKGYESYLASPQKETVNGDWVENPNGTSLVLSLDPQRALAEALESYAHNWEKELKKYRPDIADEMQAKIGSVHGPHPGRPYWYGDETPVEYIERWLSAASNLIRAPRGGSIQGRGGQ